MYPAPPVTTQVMTRSGREGDPAAEPNWASEGWANALTLPRRVTLQHEASRLVGQVMLELLDDAGIEFDAEDDEAPDMSPEQSQRLVEAMHAADAGLTAHQVQRMYKFSTRTPKLIDDYRADKFDGDVVFFSAEVEHPNPEDAALTWSDAVRGEIVNHVVRTSHTAMMSAEALSVIGPILSDELEGGGPQLHRVRR